MAGTTRWVLVVPVKRLASAKSRLASVAGEHRSDLALAFALDTVEAALAAPPVSAVVAVTDEPAAAQELAALGATVVPDQPDAGLNPALVHGTEAARATGPGLGVAVLSADLPALRPAELARALDDAAAHSSSFVRDAASDGTTLLTAAPGTDLRPQFGPGSAQRHAASGAVELTGPSYPSLRRDVDTEADLLAAAALGLGRRSGTVVGRLGTGAGHYGRSVQDIDDPTGPVTRQATVRVFHPADASGSVLFDDGTEVPFDRYALRGSGVRLLRSGQRVRVETEGADADMRVLFLTIATLQDRR